jgi:transcriptional regulator with XRE-family HTH domain
MARNSSPDEISPQFSAKLKRARQLKGLTQGQLAQKIDADIQRISKYERGVAAPTTGILVKLADALDVTTDYLIRDGESQPAAAVRDPDLLQRFVEVDILPERDREVLLTLLDAFIKKHRFEMLAAS